MMYVILQVIVYICCTVNECRLVNHKAQSALCFFLYCENPYYSGSTRSVDLTFNNKST